MKEVFIGAAKACLYMVSLVLIFLVLTGFKKPAQIDIVGILAVGAIIRHFVYIEQLKK